MNKNFINLIVLQGGWWAITLNHQNPKIFIAICLILLLIHLAYCIPRKTKELVFILGCTVIGCLFDKLAMELNLFTPAKNYTFFPEWLIFYWLIFSTSFSCSLAWLKNKWLLISILGFLMAPLTYFAGEKFGILKFNESLGLLAYIYYGLIWALSYPILFKLHQVIFSKNSAAY